MVAESRVGADVKGTLRTDAIASAWLGRASGLAWLSLMQSCRSQTNERASERILLDKVEYVLQYNTEALAIIV